MNSKELARKRRHKRARKKVFGTIERPRLSVYKSLSNIYAQIIDDTKGHTLVSASTLDDEFKDIKTNKGNIKMAMAVGRLIASRALSKGIKKIVFDRSGYKYHGSIKALADAAREGGLEF
ncbi:MAG: 50S ribosomal protein L18 [Thermodesulfovibrionales bacterium]|nr:50S ribosomal protein L18 [Thermodesulfovibrionales bacterium]